MHVKGSVIRPAYDGYVDVYAADEYEAGLVAIRKLRNTSFPEVWSSSFVVKGAKRVQP